MNITPQIRRVDLSSHFDERQTLFCLENLRPMQALHRFTSMERSLRAKGTFENFAEVMHEYFEKDHAEQVPSEELDNPHGEVNYVPLYTVHKEDSTTTQLRIVFDASAKTTSGTSLNDHLLVGPAVHPPSIDILLRFRKFRVPSTTDVSCMYQAVKLADNQKDLHRSSWRENPRQPCHHY